MADKRIIEVFSAGCGLCKDVIAEIQAQACPSCDVIERDMADEGTAQRARALGIASVPAVVIDGVLADCCAGRGPDIDALKRAGLGQPLP